MADVSVDSIVCDPPYNLTGTETSAVAYDTKGTGVPEEKEGESLEEFEERLRLANRKFKSAVRWDAADANADVVVCLLPDGWLRRIDIPAAQEHGPRSKRRPRGDDEEVWHDVFKARSLRLKRPLQVVRPATYGTGVAGYRRDGKPMTAVQDDATRAWNLIVGLYYKAGGVPWRLVREATDITTCYAGISFYFDPSSTTMRTSVAQVFNERGEGMIVKGGPAILDEDISRNDSEPFVVDAH